MKLLIVDDEKLTREGLINSIDWKSLGISSVTQADDGVNGCDIAMSFHPDIILSDIRMPRMSGIEMAERIQGINPFLSIIFMSGYSDKEYLKAAIRLKAVSYVEKPIDLEEIKEAVAEAAWRVVESKKAASSHELSLSHSRTRLALALASASGENMFPDDTVQDFPFPVDEKTPFFTFFIQFYHGVHVQNELNDMIAPLVNRLLAGQHLKEIHAVKQGFLIFFHVWGFSSYDDRHKERLGNRIIEALHHLNLRCHLAFGKNVKGARHIYDSYYSAVVELQNCFFTKENTCRVYRNTESCSFPELGSLDINERLADALFHKDATLAEKLVCDIFDTLLSRHNALPNQIRDFYYKLFSTVQEAYVSLHICPDGRAGNERSLWETISDCASIYALQELLMESLRLFFKCAESDTECNSLIYLIKKFVAEHYMDETLTIKEISEHVFLSTSYLCTLFKSETGQTLNQYLTDFRIEKAKKLLQDSRYRITDISAQVGYSDGNYFGKIFKKTVGVSPSEYREQETHS